MVVAPFWSRTNLFASDSLDPPRRFGNASQIGIGTNGRSVAPVSMRPSRLGL